MVVKNGQDGNENQQMKDKYNLYHRVLQSYAGANFKNTQKIKTHLLQIQELERRKSRGRLPPFSALYHPLSTHPSCNLVFRKTKT